ncbi:MAG: hypothetical protein ACD_20C00274G0001, partial [uncultured bacterium]
GNRNEKYESLNNSSFTKIKWQKLEAKEPYYFFIPKDFSEGEEYNKGFKIDELFGVSNSGAKTDRDSLFIDFDKKILEKRIQKLLSGDYDQAFKQEFRVLDSGSYKLTQKIKGKIFNEDYIQPIQYRPFDYKWIYYDPTLVSRAGQKVFKHIVSKDNLALLTCRQQSTFDFQHIFITKKIVDICAVSLQTKETGYVFPLYLYFEDGARETNFDKGIHGKIIANIKDKVMPENILDYIYAVLHSPSYREKYKEFLKIDFPRIPYPKDEKQFFALAKIGEELRHLHLLESPKVNNFITTYPVGGDDVVEKIKYEDGKVYINQEQYFGSVPESAWNFYIGGYQPAQKWLKDRKGRKLSNEDIEHYQKMIVVLQETERLMNEANKIVQY